MSFTRFRFMNQVTPHVALALCVGIAAIHLSAQSGPAEQSASPTVASLGDMAAADVPAEFTKSVELFQRRANIVKQIVEEKKSDGALTQLEQAYRQGQKPGKAGLEYGWAAIDVGMRLVSANELELAEKVFVAAEKSLEKTCEGFDDATESREHAQALQGLAFIRQEYLQKYLEADDAWNAAAKLDPENNQIKAGKAGFDNRWGSDVQQIRKNKSS